MAVVGLACRLAWLGEASLFVDEAWSLHIARLPLRELLAELTRFDFHPPLSYLLLKLRPGDSEAALRLSSALLGTVACVLTFALGVKVKDADTGLVAGLLYAVSAFTVQHAQEARMYALATVLVTGAALAALNQRQVVASVLLGLGAWTHYIVLLFVPFLPLGRWRAIPFLMLAPWLPSLLQQAARRPQLASEPGLQDLVVLAFQWLQGATLHVTWSTATLAALITAILVARGDRRLLPWLVGPPLLAFAASVLTGARIFSAYHYVMAAPFFWVLVATARLPHVLPVVAALNLLGCWNAWHDPEFSRGRWREVAAYVTAHPRNGDGVVLQTGYCFFVFDYYNRIGLPIWAADDESGLQPRDSLEDLQRVWYVENNAGLMDPERRVLQFVQERWTPGPENRWHTFEPQFRVRVQEFPSPR